MIQKPDILLLNPPFCRPDDIVSGIPVLAAYLESKNITIAVKDVNLEFFQRILTPPALIEGIEYALERFRELNGRSRLDLCEMYEYNWLFDILGNISQYENTYNELLSREDSFWDKFQEQNNIIKSFLMSIATCRGFPGFLLQAGFPLFGWHSPFNQFASNDIIESLEAQMFYCSTLDTLLSEYLSSYKPAIVGISISYHNQILPAFYCAKKIKESASQAHVILGGSAAQIFFRNTGNMRFFDVIDSIAIGDGEITLEKLVSRLSNQNSNLDEIPGIIYKRMGKIHKNEPAPVVPVDAISCPDYLVFPIGSYGARKENIRFPVRLSRGCYWNRCSFCRTELPMISKYQIPEEKYFFRMLDLMLEKTGCRKIHITDESVSPEAMEKLAQWIINKGIDLDWNFQTRIHGSISKGMCELFKEAGCSGISFGVESFSDRLLKLMNKGISSELVENVLTAIRGILPVTIFMMVGFPTETEEEARESFRKVRTLLSQGLIRSYVYSQFIVHSGSDNYSHPEKYGILHLMPEAGEDLSSDIRVYECEGMSREKMRELYIEFTGLRNISPGAAHIEIKGSPVSQRFDIRKIREIILSESSSRPNLPFYQLITRGSVEIRQTGETVYDH